MFRRHGLVGNVIDMTPLSSGPRGAEIQAWLSKHPDVKDFVILDDSDDMLHLLPHLIRTNNEFGLQDEHVAEVLEKLGVLPLIEQGTGAKHTMRHDTDT